jgi:hypothetical protein
MNLYCHLQEAEIAKLKGAEKILDSLYTMTLEQFVAAMMSLLRDSALDGVISPCVANQNLIKLDKFL